MGADGQIRGPGYTEAVGRFGGAGVDARSARRVSGGGRGPAISETRERGGASAPGE